MTARSRESTHSQTEDPQYPKERPSSKVGRRVDVRRRVIALERRLERRAALRAAAGLGSLLDAVAGTAYTGPSAVAHELVALLALAVAAPDAPRKEAEDDEHNGAADANNYANHRRLGVLGHAASGAAWLGGGDGSGLSGVRRR